MNKQELLQFLKEAKELGITSAEIDGMKFEFGNKEPSQRIIEDLNGPQEAKDLVAPPSRYDELTDEEVLFWSSNYGVELENAKLKEFEDSVQRQNEDTEREQRNKNA